VVPHEHAVAYSQGCNPELLPGEDGLDKDAICIIMSASQTPLAKAARVYFGIHHPIQYNVKVKDIGQVHPDHMTNLMSYWITESGDTQQQVDVTMEASQETQDMPETRQPDRHSYDSSDMHSSDQSTARLLVCYTC
jgi:hypothetical protein